MRRFKMVAAGVVVAVLASLLGMSAAPADEVRVDGDNLTPVSANTLAFGSICAGTTVTKDVLLGLQRTTSGAPNIFGSGTSPVASVQSTSSTALSAVVPASPIGADSITLPSSWHASSGVSTDTATGRVTLVAPLTPGPFAASVVFVVTGTSQAGTGISREASLPVTATVTSCDTTAPTLQLPSALTVEATGPSGATVTYTSTATDTAPASPAVTCSPASGATFAVGTTTVSCSATDAAGNTGTGSFAVSVVDTTAPTFSGTPADVTLEAAGPAGATLSYTAPSATDLVDGSRPVTCLPGSPSLVPLGTTVVTCTAADGTGNTATSRFSVTVSDRSAPSLTLPAGLTAEATSADGAAVPFTATATDTVDEVVPVTCTPASASTFSLGSTEVECSAADDSGNIASGSFTVEVEDTTPPELQLPTPAAVEATGPDGAAVTYEATATDAVDGKPDVSCSPASGSTFALGGTAVDCTASDEAGNTGSGSITVTVVDTTAPELTLPADVIAEGDVQGGKAVTFSATAVDVVDGAKGVSCSHASGSLFPVATTTVTCSVTDLHGNEATGAFTVTIRDTTAPEVTVPGATTAEATSADGAAVDFTASASDVVDGPTDVQCSPASGSMFPLGQTTVTCSATDTAGNTGSASIAVTVRDTTPPEIGEITDVTAEAAGPAGASVDYAVPTASDAVDGSVEVTCEPAAETVFALGDTTVTCEATDVAGNRAQRTFMVTISDTTGPLLLLPDAITEEATGPGGAAVTYTPTASDLVDGSRPLSCDPPSGSTFGLGTATVDCTASDTRGNSSRGSFTVTVEDTTPPTIAVPVDMTKEATGPDGAAVEFDASATDIVDGAVEVSCDADSGATFPLGTTPVSCTATDASGNDSERTFQVEVVDTTDPAVTVPDDIVAEATGPAGAIVTFEASATDIVSGTVITTCTPASGSTFSLTTTAVSCSATDAAGNTGQAEFSVIVQDTTPPVVAAPPDQTLEATGPDGAVATFSATATDVVDGSVAATCTPAAGVFPLGTTTVTCTAVDAAENDASRSFTITVEDTTAPTIGDVTDLELEATGPGGAVGTYTTPVATDVVDGTVDVTCEPPSGSIFRLGANPVECSATDEAGNTGTNGFTVGVADTTEPALALPTAMTVEATGPAGAPVPFSATAHDVVDGHVAVACDPTSGSTFRLGETSVRCAAADHAGNEAAGSFLVTVRDTTAPAVAVNPDITAEATGPAGAVVTYAASATDIVDGDVDVSCTTPSGSTFPLGATEVTCTATDEAGNGGSGAFTVTVRDTTAPVVTVPGARTAVATSSAGAVVSFTASADDIVDGTLPVPCSPGAGSTFPLGSSTVTCTVTDEAGNTGTGSFTVTVQLDLGGGLLSPVRPDGLNVVKGGSTVPLKWQVSNPAGGYVADTAIVSGFKVFALSCQALDGGGTEEVATTTGGTQLRYDSTANQFIQNWQTPKKPGTCYRAEIQFRGGQKLAANFQLK